MNTIYYGNELYHHGILGQKWGVRRYQNENGTLTDEGKKRYGVSENGWISKEGRKNLKADRKEADAEFSKYLETIPKSERAKAFREYINSSDSEAYKILDKQDRLEERFKFEKNAQKILQNEGDIDGIKRQVDIIVDKRGDVKLKEVNDQIEKGYALVKSMDDVFNYVTADSFKNINYGNVKRERRFTY